MNSYPTDLELGLDEPLDDPSMVIERCGCQVHPADLHDVTDCLETQVDDLAYREDLRRGGLWEMR